jgi:hypothetical protein
MDGLTLKKMASCVGPLAPLLEPYPPPEGKKRCHGIVFVRQFTQFNTIYKVECKSCKNGVHTNKNPTDIGGLPVDRPSPQESPGDTGNYVLVAENFARASRCKAVETLPELNSSVPGRPGPW